MTVLPAKLRYDCSKCPAYCCSYQRIPVTPRDIERLARHFDLTPEEAKKRYTKFAWGEQVLRHRKDHIYESVCAFLDRETRRCTVYEARPEICRGFPEASRCGYYEFISWERRRQDDPDWVPLAPR
jgi:Fe-S-cluster containining protein